MKNNSRIKLRKQILKDIKSHIGNYELCLENFNLKHLKNATGKDTLISVIGTGLPTNATLKTVHYEILDEISRSKDEYKDEHGFSTILSSIVAENRVGVYNGIAINSKFIFCKSFNNDGKAFSSSICAGIVLSSIKKSNIIVLPYESNQDNEDIFNSIKLAYSRGCIVVSPKNKNGNTYPADYDEVISIGNKNYCDIKIEKIKNDIYSRTANGKYARITGVNAYLSLGVGFISRYIEKYPNFSIKTIKDFFC